MKSQLDQSSTARAIREARQQRLLQQDRRLSFLAGVVLVAAAAVIFWALGVTVGWWS